jgi:hypothetical protein
MKSIILFICLIVLFGLTRVSWGADYSGFWKGDCTNNFGIQIKPTGNELYSVSFCGPGGCSEPGEWTPNTRIEGDPKYKIISPGEVGIKRNDNSDFFIYRKCTNDPTWTVSKPETSELKKIPDCSFDTGSKEEGVLIAWVTDVREFTECGQGIKTQTIKVGPFRPIALLNNDGLKETEGATMHKGQSFWRVLSPSTSPQTLHSVGSYFDHIVDHCVYFGNFEKAIPLRWTLFSSKPLSGVFRAPSSKDTEEFYRLNTTCVQQGDYPEGQEPPCIRPKLLAVTELNKRGKPEYWATEPYLWDTGLTVWENNNGTLTPLIQVCVGCSD